MAIVLSLFYFIIFLGTSLNHSFSKRPFSFCFPRSTTGKVQRCLTGTGSPPRSTSCWWPRRAPPSSRTRCTLSTLSKHTLSLNHRTAMYVTGLELTTGSLTSCCITTLCVNPPCPCGTRPCVVPLPSLPSRSEVMYFNFYVQCDR